MRVRFLEPAEAKMLEAAFYYEMQVEKLGANFLDRLLQNANFPNFFVGKINLILRILHVCLRSN